MPRLESIPIRVVLNPKAALLGALLAAMQRTFLNRSAHFFPFCASFRISMYSTTSAIPGR